MGACHIQGSKIIKVATLNYSGILLSPFQFYNTESKAQLEVLSEIFKKLIIKNPKTNIQGFKWDLGSIDKKIQAKRYTPIYKKQAGIQNGKILSRSQFIIKWNQYFEKSLLDIPPFKYTKEEKDNVLLFDQMCFQTFLIHLYNVSSWENISNQSPQKYIQFCDKNFKKAFLSNDIKLQKTLKALQEMSLDIIFLQEKNDYLIQALLKLVEQKKFIMKDHQASESVILIKKQKFQTYQDLTNSMLQKLTQQQAKRLNWNNDTALMFYGDLILISSHISAKQTKNKDQINQVYQDLTFLTQKFPKHKIILGFDANTKDVDGQMITPLIPHDFYTIPQFQQTSTVAKKRTMLQVQMNKANSLSKKRSDYIISNAKVLKSQVCTIGGRTQNLQNQLLPSNQHPFDHFIVTASLKFD